MTLRMLVLTICFSLSPLGAEPLQVVALHPLMADLARQLGGDRVDVHDLVGEAGDPHRFEPRPNDMRSLREASLVLAAGMGLEPYLDQLRDTLGDDKLIEIGSDLPALQACGSHGGCGHAHHGLADPHWWQSISLMGRASRVVAAEFGRLDPAGQVYYQDQARSYRKRLDELERWARLELAKVPAPHRKLVTPHHAFGYFADEFGFETLSIAGLNPEQRATPKDLAATIQSARSAGVPALFPEQFSSRRTIEAVAAESGLRIGEPLIADGNGRGESAGFEGMIRHNVAAITRALAPTPQTAP